MMELFVTEDSFSQSITGTGILLFTNCGLHKIIYQINHNINCKAFVFL